MVAVSLTSNQSEAGSFDPSVIESLAGIMSASALRSLLTDLINDACVRLERVAEIQIAPGSLPMIERDAHDLKSMSGNFGLTELSQRAGVVERAARDGCVESVREGVPAMLSSGRGSLKSLAEQHEITCGRAL